MNNLMVDESERLRLGKQATLVSKEYSLKRIMGLWDEMLVELIN